MNYVYHALLALMLMVGAPTVHAQEAPAYLSTEEAEALLDLSLTPAERDSMQEDLQGNMRAYRSLHAYQLDNAIPPALVFDPRPQGFEMPAGQQEINWALKEKVAMPANEEDLAFYSVADLSVLIRSGQVSSRQLTGLFIDRLKRYSDTLECTITLLEERAYAHADQMDRELQEGKYRGPLHGIPYGIKDLFALPRFPTTWGATPYREQYREETATVISKLEAAGAVLIVKLTLGALAMGDVWYGGKTRNPWNLEEGSSGSSAGSGAATAAGLVPFAIGTETLGSIVSPSNRNGVTGLRPTFGRVSRHGAMALSWSMDKVGPMCRSAEDCALVFEAIRGADGKDPSVRDAPFNYDAGLDLSGLKVGYFKSFFERDYPTRANDEEALAVFRGLGLELEEVSMPDSIPYGALRIILAAEAGAAFDELTRSGADDELVRQDKNAWPNFFRSSRFIPAVEYVNANRIRYELIQQMDTLFRDYDLIISPTYGGPQLLATNLTGHPVVCLPNGFNEAGSPTSITLVGRLYDEATILAVARAFQQATSWDESHPPRFVK